MQLNKTMPVHDDNYFLGLSKKTYSVFILLTFFSRLTPSLATWAKRGLLWIIGAGFFCKADDLVSLNWLSNHWRCWGQQKITHWSHPLLINQWLLKERTSAPIIVFTTDHFLIFWIESFELLSLLVAVFVLFIGDQCSIQERLQEGETVWFVMNQVTHELMSYDTMADGPYQHTWWYNDFGGQWEKTVFFPAATTGMDTNTTVDVCSVQINLCTQITTATTTLV